MVARHRILRARLELRFTFRFGEGSNEETEQHYLSIYVNVKMLGTVLRGRIHTIPCSRGNTLDKWLIEHGSCGGNHVSSTVQTHQMISEELWLSITYTAS